MTIDQFFHKWGLMKRGNDELDGMRADLEEMGGQSEAMFTQDPPEEIDTGDGMLVRTGKTVEFGSPLRSAPVPEVVDELGWEEEEKLEPLRPLEEGRA